MLDALRRGVASWLAKGLLFLLILSFAVWGIADVFRGYGAGSLAKVGSHEITSDEFRRTYQMQLDDIRRRFGGRITAEQARALGLEQQVLSRLIGAAAIDHHAGELGLALSNDKLVELVRADPSFQGVDGRFNRIALDGTLSQMGLSEKAYLDLRRKDETRDQLTGAMFGAVTPPDYLVELMHKYREETRTVTHFAIDPGTVKLPEPDDAKLKQTYETNKRQFVIPESRKIALLKLKPETVKSQVQISDADVKSAYDRELQSHQIPERRKLQQIAFKDRAAAQAARTAISGGKTFEDVAKEAGAKESDIELGLRTKRDLIDPKIADAAFALAKGVVSEVVEGQFATVLLRATEIEPGRQKPLEEVRDEIRTRLAAEPLRELVQKLHDQVDDLRAAAKPLSEIASTLKLDYAEIAELDSRGNTVGGKPAIEGPDGSKIAAAVFEGRAGVESEAIELADGGYAWFDILATTPEKQKPYEDVAADVNALWLDVERRSAISALAAALADRAGKGEPMEKLAAEAGGKVETTRTFKRFGAQPALPEPAVNQAFILAKGKATSAETRDGTSRIVLRLDDIVTAGPPTKEEADRIRAELVRQMQQDAVAEYVAGLQDRIGVTINQAELRRATGADVGQ